jgi:hypothetical protein
MVCTVALTLCVPAAADVQPPEPTAAPAPDAAWQRGFKLRAELAAEYKRLRATRKLSNRIGLDNDVTTIVIKYIPVGTSLDDARAIMRAAGCLVGVSPDGHVFGRAAMKDGLLDVKHTFSVDLAPGAANDDGAVDEVRASIFTTYTAKDIK